MAHDMVNVLLLPDTNLLEKFPELEQKVDYFLYDWDESSLLLTNSEVARQIREKQSYYNRFFSIKKRQKKAKLPKKTSSIEKYLVKKLSEELETLKRSRNVLWRNWAVEKKGPQAKYPPEKINWNKDADLIFLYGPIYKNTIELPWSCRSPNILLKGSLKSALKRSSPLSLLGTVSPPSYFVHDHQLNDSFISYNDYLTNAEYELNKLRPNPPVSRKSIIDDMASLPTAIEATKHEKKYLTHQKNCPTSLYRKNKIRFNKQVEQCMVVFRQEEELLPTDFEDFEDDENSNSTMDTLNNQSDSELFYPFFGPENSVQANQQPNSRISSNDTHSKVQSSESNSTAVATQNSVDIYSNTSQLAQSSSSNPSSSTSVNSRNTASSPTIADPSEFPEYSDFQSTLPPTSTESAYIKSGYVPSKRKGRNRNTFVIKLASTALKDSSSSKDDTSSYTGLNLRRKLMLKNRSKNQAILPDSILINTDSESDSDSQGSWIWSTLGLSSPRTNNSPNTENSSHDENITLSSPSNQSPTSISSLSGTVQNLISKNWNNLWVPNAETKASSHLSPQINPDLDLDELKPSNYETDININIDTNTTEDTTTAPSSPQLPNNATPLIVSTSQPKFDYNTLITDFTYSTPNTHSIVPDNPGNLSKGSTSALWPSIKESGEVLLDNAEDRIATTVDAVKWLSSFFSNYNPF